MRSAPALIAAFLLATLPWVSAAQPNVANGQLIAVGGKEAGVQTACFRCHGIDGAGDSSGAFPRLTGQFVEYTLKQMRDYASGARENAIMSPIARALSEQDWLDVSAYYAQLRAPDLGRKRIDVAMLQRGAILSASGSAERRVQACVNCHGPAGVGIAPHYPYLAGQFASYMELQFEQWKNGTRANDPFNVMAEIAHSLSDEDIRAVSLYFESLRPVASAPPGRVQPPRTPTYTAQPVR